MICRCCESTVTTGAAANSCSRADGGSNILSPGNSREDEVATVNWDDHSSSGDGTTAVVMIVVETTEGVGDCRGSEVLKDSLSDISSGILLGSGS